MNPNAPGFNDPQFAPKRPACDDGKKLFESVHDGLLAEATGYLQNDDAVGRLGRKVQNVPEVVVEGDQRALFGNTGFEDSCVACAAESFATNCCDVVSRPPQEAEPAWPEILVKFELHGAARWGQG